MENQLTLPPRDDPNFGPNLKRFREEVLHLTRKDLADKLGAGVTTIYNWEEKGPGCPEPTMSASAGGYAILPPSERLYKRLVAFVERGETFEKNNPHRSHHSVGRILERAESTTSPSKQVPFVPGLGLDFSNITEGDLIRELIKRGFKVTLSS